MKKQYQLICTQCNKEFTRVGRDMFAVRNGAKPFCSVECANLGKMPKTAKKTEVKCLQCSKNFLKRPSDIRRSPNHFCCRSCSVTYRNCNKTTGVRRSKLEKWIEEQLSSMYSFEIHFNKKDAINSELDIYIPSLRLAFELNGVFHYEPIYGDEKLSQIQNNDDRKFQACLEEGIELCIIDTSQQKYFKPKTSQKYLDIITSVVERKQRDSNP